METSIKIQIPNNSEGEIDGDALNFKVFEARWNSKLEPKVLDFLKFRVSNGEDPVDLVDLVDLVVSV